ncbi:MAG TPA: aminotransferase class I/II-fold pyridoxal phosphate-dependent enzyme [Candidatus Thermoplasmatota archaeon]|nr:aminotransferase class I/II-fold pyridoxal phosphate-dependent enzyme [Candidatus Thermoplasmatota archaeon]
MSERDPTRFLRDEYQDLVAKGFDWRPPVMQGPAGPRARYNGKDCLVLCANNYLNLANHPKLKQAAIDAAQKYGAGSGSVRPIAGNMELHEEVERRVATFKHTEAALLYMSGFAANAGLLGPLAGGEGDLVVTDELNHGSIIDGLRLSKAERLIYKHNDLADLERCLQEAETKGAKRVLVVTDGVFSMDGDIAPLPGIVKAAEAHGAMVYVDDAHGEGVLGEGGRGCVDHFKLTGKVHVEIGTFSKALGVVGGYAAGSKDLRSFALNKSRSWLLSASPAPAVCGASIAAIDVLEKEPLHVQRLWENTRYWKQQLLQLGFDTGRSETPIVPVMMGESHVAKKFSERLFDLGVFALPITFPMVARDKARIRTIMNAGLTRSDLDQALEAFATAGRELKLVR